MKKHLLTIATLALAAGAALGGQVTVATIEAAIMQPTRKFVDKAISAAEAGGSTCIVFQLDTPGGDMESMRQIIKRFMASRVPVVVYVSPAGSRAASAGAFITIAAHVAAMAPGTNIGAAHPVSGIPGVQIDSIMSGKVTNDAAASIRSIAEKRGRNISWADSAVRKSVSLSETEALKLRVIDLLAPSLDALLDSLDGRVVRLDNGAVDTLRTKGATVERVAMTWHDKFLLAVSKPDLAFIFFMLGLLGLYFEFNTPGAVLPGVVGAISLILAIFAFQVLPVSATGILLIVLSIVLFIIDVKAATHGVLTVGGIVAMFFGSLFLFNSPDPAMHASLQVIIPVVLVTAAFFAIGVWLSVRALGKKPLTGQAGMIGREGDARTRVTKDGGKVFVAGAHWSAWSESDIAEGSKIKVVAVKGMTLQVEKLP
jgi:membrane-bound serine protease (ClpP class)